MRELRGLHMLPSLRPPKSREVFFVDLEIRFQLRAKLLQNSAGLGVGRH